MKRPNFDVVGRPQVPDRRRDVAGVPARSKGGDVASFRHALGDPLGVTERERALIDEYEEFMACDEEIDSGWLPTPDPAFRERLRRRLWRTHAVTNLPDGRELH